MFKFANVDTGACLFFARVCVNVKPRFGLDLVRQKTGCGMKDAESSVSLCYYGSTGLALGYLRVVTLSVSNMRLIQRRSLVCYFHDELAELC